MRDTPRARWALGLLAVQLTALGWLARGLRGRSGYPLDDSWIHAAVARTLAVHGVLAVAPGMPRGGSSSLAWTVALALGDLLGRNPVAWSLGLCAVCFVAFGQALYALAVDDGIAPPRAATLAALAALTGNFTWFAFTGMEHLAFCALSALALHRWFAPGTDPRRPGAPAAGWLLAALVLTRPDALGLPVLVAALARTARRDARAVGTAVAPPGVAFALACALTRWRSGTWLPGTFGGRRWLYRFAPTGLPPLTRGARWLAHKWPERLRDFTLGGSAAAWWSLAALALVGITSLVIHRRRGTGALVAWAGAHLATFVVVFPISGHGGRYQPLVPGLFLPLAALGALEIADRVGRLFAARGSVGGPTPPALTALALAVPLVFATRSLDRWRAITDAGVTHIDGTQRTMGLWVRDHVPRGDTVATFDLGAVAYFSARPVVDLGGLVDPGYLPSLWSGHVGAYLRARGVRWVVLPAGYHPTAHDGQSVGYLLGLLDDPSLRMSPVMAFGTPPAVWAVAAAATNHASPMQVLYRVEYPGDPSAPRGR